MPILFKTASTVNILILAIFFAFVAPAIATNGQANNDGKNRPLTFSLTCPVGDGPYSTAILLTDETTQGKIAAQVPQALAEKDIAVITCKTAYQKSGESDCFNQQTASDALQAVALLQSNKKIDQRHIFVLAHGKSAFSVPLIAEANQNISGFVLLAGAAGAAEAKKESNYNPAKAMQQIKRPVLILHGTADTTLGPDDFQSWWEALDGRSNTTFKVYSGLDHNFCKKGEQIVSAEVTGDLSKWLKAQE